MAGAHRSAHQPLTRIGDARHAGVGDDDDGLSGVEHIEHGAGRRGLGVVVDDEQLRLGDSPACSSSRPVRRVSSHAMTSADASASTARGESSPRFPIGVATSTQHGSGHSTTSRRCPVTRFHRANAPASASTTERAVQQGSPTRLRAHPHRAPHETVTIEERDVDVEPHAERVHRSRRSQQERSVDPVAPEKALAARGAACGRPRLRRARPVPDEPRHGGGLSDESAAVDATHDQLEDERDRSQPQRAEDRGADVVDREAVDDPRRERKDDCVHREQREPQGDDRERRRQELEDEPQGGIEHHVHEGGQEDGPPVLLVDARDDRDHHREADRERHEADAQLAQHGG